MKRNLLITTTLILLLSFTSLELSATASTRGNRAMKRKTNLVLSDNNSRLQAAEERARVAEERAREAESAASQARNEAQAAKEQAEQAVAAANRADSLLLQMNQKLAHLEESINQQAKVVEPARIKEEKNTAELRAVKKIDEQTPGNVSSQTTQNEGAVTSVSKMPVKIYGSLLINSNFVDKGTNNIDIPLFVQKAGSASDQNHQNFNMTARQTRLGLRYEGKVFTDAKLTGVFEFDLFGGKPAFSNGAHFDLFRLRLAYARIDWQKNSLEAGQDWAVFSPLNPTTIASFAIPGFATSGNLWYRMPQIRYEHREQIGAKSRLVYTAAMLDPNAGDNSGNPAFRQVGLGERGSLPAFEARIGFTTPTHEKESAIGLSGHYSRLLAEPGNAIASTLITTRSPIDSYGVSMDANLWLSSGVRLTGEAFHGRALGTFSGNIAQAVNVLNGHAIGINSTGGWFEMHAEAPKGYIGSLKNFSANFGYGIEDNRDKDLNPGLRNRNQTFLGNGQYKFSPAFNLALEYRRINTDYFKQQAASQAANWINLGLLFSF